MVTRFAGHLLREDLLPEAPVVIDAGACLGKFSLAILRLRPQARIITVEACIGHVRRLVKIPNLEICGGALIGDEKVRSVEFCECERRPGWGYVATADNPRVLPAGVRRDRTYACPTITLPRLFERFGIVSADLLKLDIEGSEASVLRNLPPQIARNIQQITMESHPWAWSNTEARATLRRLGYTVEPPDGEGLEMMGFQEALPRSARFPVAVISCGRTGTNVVLEMLRASGQFLASEYPEDKVLCRHNKLSPIYLTKCDTYYFKTPELLALMDRNPTLHIIFTVRDPRDTMLSKMYRGRPYSVGGDCDSYADDATVDGAIKDMEKAEEVRVALAEKYPTRLLVIELEDGLRDVEGRCRQLAAWCGVEFRPEMCEFWKGMRQWQKVQRYKGLDLQEVELWKRWREAYGGFFATQDMETAFGRLGPLIRAWGYADVDA